MKHGCSASPGGARGLSRAQVELRKAAREIAEGPVAARAAEIDRTEEYPWDNVALLVEAGLVGMTIPKPYGGGGRSWLDTVLVVEELAKHCAVTARIAVETNMGAISAIMAFGTRSLSDLLRGRQHGPDHSPALPQPAAGSSFVVSWPVLPW